MIRLEVGMHDQRVVLLLDVGLELVRVDEERRNREADLGRPARVEDVTPDWYEQKMRANLQTLASHLK